MAAYSQAGAVQHWLEGALVETGTPSLEDALEDADAPNATQDETQLHQQMCFTSPAPQSHCLLDSCGHDAVLQQEAQLSEGRSTGASLQGEATLHHCPTSLSCAAGPEPVLKLAAAPTLLQYTPAAGRPMQDAEPDPEAVATQAPAPQAWQHQLQQHLPLLQQLQPQPAGGSSTAPQHTVQKELSHALLGVLNPLESVLWQQRQHQRNLLDRALHALTSLQTDVDMLLVAAKSGSTQQQQHQKLLQSGFVPGTDMARQVPDGAVGAGGSPAQHSAAGGNWSIAAAWGPDEPAQASFGSTALLPARPATLPAVEEPDRKQPGDPAQLQQLGGLEAERQQQQELQQQWMGGCDDASGLAAEFEAELLHAEAAAPGRRLSEETLKQYTTLVWHSSMDDADDNISKPPAAATPDSNDTQQESPCSQQHEAVGARDTFPSTAVLSPPAAAQEDASGTSASKPGLASTAQDVLQQAGGAATGDSAGLRCMDSFEEQLLAVEAAAPGRRPAVSAELDVCEANGNGSGYFTDPEEASSGAGLQDTCVSSDAGCSNGKASSSPAVQGDSLTGAAALAASEEGDQQQHRQPPQQQQQPEDDGPDPLVPVSAGGNHSSASHPDCKSPHKHVVFSLPQPDADAQASAAACERDPAAGSTAVGNISSSNNTQLQTDVVAAGCSSSCDAAGPSSITSSASGTHAGLQCSTAGASGDGSMGMATAGVQQLAAALGPTGDCVRPDSVGGLTNFGSSSSSIGCFGSFHGTPMAAATAAVGTTAAAPAAAAVMAGPGSPGVALEAAEGCSDVGVCDSSDDFESMLRAQEAAAREAAGFAAGRSSDGGTGRQEEERWWSQDCDNTASSAAGCLGSSESSGGQPGGCQVQAAASPAPAVPPQASKAKQVSAAAAAASVPASDAAGVAKCPHQLARPTAAAAAAGSAASKGVLSLKAATDGTLSSPSASSISSDQGFTCSDGGLLVTLNLGQPGSIGATLGLPLSPDSATATGLQEFTLAAAAQGCSSNGAEYTAGAAAAAAVLPEDGAVQLSVMPSVQESMPQVSTGQASMVPVGQNPPAAAAAAGQAWHAADPGSLQQLPLPPSKLQTGQQQLPAAEATVQDVQLQQELTLHDTCSWQECSFAAVTAPAAAATPTAAQGPTQQQLGHQPCQQGLLSEAGRDSGPQTQGVCQYDGIQSILEPHKQLGQQEGDPTAIPAHSDSLCSINCSSSASSGVSVSSSTAADAQGHPPAAAGSNPAALGPGQAAGKMGGGCTVLCQGGHWGQQAVALTLGQSADPQSGAPPLQRAEQTVAGCHTPTAALPCPAATPAGPQPQPPAAAAAVCSIGRPASAPGGVSKGAAGSAFISTGASWQQLSSVLHASPAQQQQHQWQSRTNANSNPNGTTVHQLQHPHQCPHTAAPQWPAQQPPQPDAQARAAGSSSPQRQLRHVQSLPATPSQPDLGAAAAAAATSFYSGNIAAAGQDAACHGSEFVGCSCCQPGWSTAAAAATSRAGHRATVKCSSARQGPLAGALGAADNAAPESMLHCAVDGGSCATKLSRGCSTPAAFHTSASASAVAAAAQTAAQQETWFRVGLEQYRDHEPADLPARSAHGFPHVCDTCSSMPVRRCRPGQCSHSCGCTDPAHMGSAASAAGCADSGTGWAAAPLAHASSDGDDQGILCHHGFCEPQGTEDLNCSHSAGMVNLHGWENATPALRCLEAYNDLLHLQQGFADADISTGNHSCDLEAAAGECPVQNCDRRWQYGSQQLQQHDHYQDKQQQQQQQLEQQLAALDQRVQQLHRVAAASTCADRDLQHTLTQQLRHWQTVQQQAEEQEYQAACGTALQQAVISPRRQQRHRHKHKPRHQNHTFLQPGGDAWIQQHSQAAVLSPTGPAHCAICGAFACTCATSSSCRANSTSAAKTYGRVWQDGSASSRLSRPYSASAVLAAPAAGHDGFRPQVLCAATAASRRAGSALGYSSATAHRTCSSWLLQAAVQECCQEQLEQAVMAAEGAALAAEAQVVAAAITCTRQLLGG